MHSREDLHRCIPRIVADELFVNLENSFQLAIKNLGIDVREIEVNHRLAIYAEVVLVHHLMNGTGGNVARYEIAVFRIPFFEEVPAFALRDRLGIPLIARSSWDPHTAAFSASRLGHQPQLVFARNRCGVHLDELAICVVTALLIKR